MKIHDICYFRVATGCDEKISNHTKICSEGFHGQYACCRYPFSGLGSNAHDDTTLLLLPLKRIDEKTCDGLSESAAMCSGKRWDLHTKYVCDLGWSLETRLHLHMQPTA